MKKLILLIPLLLGLTLSSVPDHSVLSGLTGQGTGGGADDHGLGSDDSPTWTGRTITGNSVLGLNSAVFQPATDSTTFFQIKDAAGTAYPISVDTVDIRVGINSPSPRVPLEIYNTGTGTGDLPGGLNSVNIALILRSDPSVTMSRPGIVQYGLRTAGSGIAYDINSAFIGSAEANVIRAATIGVWGQVGASAHTIEYVYLDARTTGAYNQSTLKIDNNNRIGIGLSGTLRPAYLLDVNGETRIQNNLYVQGKLGLNELDPETRIEITHAQPYRTIHHNTHENTADGREIFTYFKGEKGDGTEFVQAMTKIAHDGSGDDQKTYWDSFINDGDDGDSPTFAMRLNSVGLGIGTSTQVSLLEADGALGLAIETVTGDTTLDKTHSTLVVNASGNVTVTLPTAASAYNSTDGIGRIYRIKKIDADADMVTVDGNGAELIDGAATAVITIQWEVITIQSNGTEWYIL